jgi:hypothetical protein
VLRGIAIEHHLASTEYSIANGWFRVGAEKNGYFELFVFQRDNTLVSMKTADTTSKGWLKRIKNDILELLGAGRASMMFQQTICWTCEYSQGIGSILTNSRLLDALGEWWWP